VAGLTAKKCEAAIVVEIIQMCQCSLGRRNWAQSCFCWRSTFIKINFRKNSAELGEHQLFFGFAELHSLSLCIYVKMSLDLS